MLCIIQENSNTKFIYFWVIVMVMIRFRVIAIVMVRVDQKRYLFIFKNESCTLKKKLFCVFSLYRIKHGSHGIG